MTFTSSDAMGVVDQANCHDHPCVVPFTEADIDTVYHFDAWCNCGSLGQRCGSYCDSGSCAIFTLKDGRWVLAQEDSDSSGHG